MKETFHIHLPYILPVIFCLFGCFMVLASSLYAKIMNLDRKGEFYTLLVFSFVPIINWFVALWQLGVLFAWIMKKIKLPGHIR